MEGTSKVCYLIFAVLLIVEFTTVRGQLINGVSSTTSSLLNGGGGRILNHITPIPAYSYQTPVTYFQNSYGYPTGLYRAADAAPSGPGCTCRQYNRNANLPPLMGAFVRNSAGPEHGNTQPFLRESLPQGEIGYIYYS